MKKMKKNKKLNRKQKQDCTVHQENKWFIMMVKIEFLERKKHRHMNESVLSRVRLCGKFGMNMEMNQNNWQQMNYNKKEEEEILKPKHIKLNLKKKTLFGSKKRKDIVIWK